MFILFPAIQPVDLTPGFLFREELPDFGPGGTGGVTPDTVHHPVPAMRPVFVIFFRQIAAHHSLSWVPHRKSLPVQPVRRSSGKTRLLPDCPGQPLVFCQLVRCTDILREKFLADVGYRCPGKTFQVLQLRCTGTETEHAMRALEAFSFGE